MNIPAWRDGRAVEGGGLENRCAQAPWVRILLPPPRGPDKRRFFGRDDREADGARLLSECGVILHRGFKSLSLRHMKKPATRESGRLFLFAQARILSGKTCFGRHRAWTGWMGKSRQRSVRGPGGIHGLSAPCPERPCAPDALRLVFCAAFLYSCGANRQGIRPGQSTREPPCVPI